MQPKPAPDPKSREAFIAEYGLPPFAEKLTEKKITNWNETKEHFKVRLPCYFYPLPLQIRKEKPERKGGKKEDGKAV